VRLCRFRDHSKQFSGRYLNGCSGGVRHG
jgi:hypothetical protein